MSDRKIFYISMGLFLLGVFLLGWGALTDVMAISVIGMIALPGAFVFRSYWWLKKSSGK